MLAFDAFIRIAKQQNLNDNNDENFENIRFRQTKEAETLLINLDEICTNYRQIKV